MMGGKSLSSSSLFSSCLDMANKVAFDYHEISEDLDSRDESWETTSMDPDGLEIVSPSTVVISGRPSVDVLEPEIGQYLSEKYASYMSGKGPQEVSFQITSERKGLLAFEYDFDAPSGEHISDFWDYQGPVRISTKVSFLDSPLRQVSGSLETALKRAFLSQGYDETDAAQSPHYEELSQLRFKYRASLLKFSSNRFYVPTKTAAYGLEDDSLGEAIVAASPRLFLHW